ncbi:MAG: excinuclease ABC subunit UvrA [Flavobacteriaceae bacterium]|nr:excinuclease ABC subunit UvrA [Flavobacteriaceae bacterium]
MKEEQSFIEIFGAREHNLKNLSLKIPRDKLVVITGLSGSGKSSLAFDTIYAEGQRRYMETFSAYARQFIGDLERPDVDKINGLSPVISIEQKTTNRSPRSTVGTITEIYDFLRLLYARISDAYSFETNEKMVGYTSEQIHDIISKEYNDVKIAISSPVVRSRKGHYRELFEQISKKGFLKVRVNNEIVEITPGMKLDRYKTHDIDIIVDRLKINEKNSQRLMQVISTALKHGDNVLSVSLIDDPKEIRHFSLELMCPTTGISYKKAEPNNFSFNSPKGACSNCKGLGNVLSINKNKIIPDDKISISKGGIIPLGEEKNNWIFNQIKNIALKYNFDLLKTPISKISEDAMDIILYGGKEYFSIQSKIAGAEKKYTIDFEGINSFIKNQYDQSESSSLKKWALEYMDNTVCDSCNGSRLSKESLFFRIDNKNISEVSNLDISNLSIWINNIEKTLSENNKTIAKEIIKEIDKRIQFLLDVGLDYLNLNRGSGTLSGGESQRIRLATQIGSQLMGVLYILDEPSIGLHQRDNEKLIKSLVSLRDKGNSVIVVEHDRDMMEVADHIIDMGPKAGIYGGEIVSEGKFSDIIKGDTLTAKYLNGDIKIEIKEILRKGTGKSIILKGATGNNLKNVDIKIPLGKFISVTGVSGSGKSTLINHTLYPILHQHVYKQGVKKPMPYKSIKGLENIDKVIAIDQSPIGRTPRSNPVTYTGAFTEIRSIFAKLPESLIRGYKAGRFSFNVKGGRCEECKGAGIKIVEMNFLPDVHVHCDVCNGKRFNRETLEVRFKGNSISDILNMTIEKACEFFDQIPKIHNKLSSIQKVGLGYITLGQQSTTLSGGEAQRIKLASELSKKATGNTFYILDEPTTGLHFEDINVLLNVLHKLVDKGNTVLVIEHNIDVIKVSDYIIDIGPEGGQKGGNVVVTGTPKQICKNNKSYTGKYLKKELNL